MPSFPCPKCKKVLKTSTPIAAGKRVKCPSCAQVFTVPEAAEEKTGIQSNKPVAPAPKSAATSEPKRRRPDPDDEDEAPRRSSRKARARDDEDDPDEEDEDRPARRRGKKKKGSNKGLILALGGAGALLLILVIAAFLWPGFLVRGGGGPKGAVAGKEAAAQVDPLAFVPDTCDFLVGGNLSVLRTNPAAMMQFEQALRQNNNLRPEQLELIRNADRGIVAGSGAGLSGNLVLAFTSVEPLDPQKVRQAFDAGPAETIQGKTVYRIGGVKGIPGRDFLAVPGDKIVVVGNMPEMEFVKLLDAKGKLSPDMQAQVNALSQKTGWAVVNLQAVLKDKTKELNGLVTLPGGAQAVPALKSAKLASIAMDMASDASLRIDVQCANDQDAGHVENFARNLWEQQAKPALAAVPFFLGKQPGIEAIKLLINEINQTFQIQRQGPQVSASLTITEKTMKEVEKFQPPGGFNADGPPGVKAKKKF